MAAPVGTEVAAGRASQVAEWVGHRARGEWGTAAQTDQGSSARVAEPYPRAGSVVVAAAAVAAAVVDASSSAASVASAACRLEKFRDYGHFKFTDNCVHW